MNREGASDSAVPGLGTLAVGHQAHPVGLDEPTYVLVPSEEAMPPSLLYHQVVQHQVCHIHPVAGKKRTHWNYYINQMIWICIHSIMHF